MKKIDFEAHFITQEWLEQMFENKGYPKYVRDQKTNACRIEWGDGAISIGGTERIEGPLQSQADYATHVYQQPGNYTITMKCTDTDGATTLAYKTVNILPFP